MPLGTLSLGTLPPATHKIPVAKSVVIVTLGLAYKRLDSGFRQNDDKDATRSRRARPCVAPRTGRRQAPALRDATIVRITRILTYEESLLLNRQVLQCLALQTVAVEPL